MMRLAAGILVLALVGVPLAVLPAAPVTWLALAGLGLGGVGVLALSVPLVTAAATLALVAYAVALGVARPAADPVASVVFGALLVLTLALVHLAGRMDGALVGPGVVAGQLRQWMIVIALGLVAAAVFTTGAAALGPVVVGAALPVVVIAAALGALLTVAGVVALVTAPRSAEGARRGGS